MANVKIVLRKNMKRKDGTIPLALRISENYKTSYQWIGQYVLEKDWDPIQGKVRRSHPNYKKLNNYLMKKIVKVNDIYFTSEDPITPKKAKKKLQGANGAKSVFALAAERIKEKYERGTYSVAKSELSILYNLEEFLNLKRSKEKSKVVEEIKERRLERMRKAVLKEYNWLDGVKYFQNKTTLRFHEIDEAFLKRYKTFCVSYLNQQNRTVTNQLIYIRTLFNLAIKEEIVDRKFYPFAGEKEKIRIGSGNKIGLTIEEIEKIESLKLKEETSIWHTRNVWLLAFYFAGIRIADVLKLKWSDFKDNRLYYVMNKNDKALSLKIPHKAVKILGYYEKNKKLNKGYVFPYLRNVHYKDSEGIYRKTKNATKLFNKYLKRIAEECNIDKNLSNHIARHSFGNIAGDKIHPLMLQKLYRHSNLKTTLNYQANFLHQDADEALDSVVNFKNQ